MRFAIVTNLNNIYLLTQNVILTHHYLTLPVSNAKMTHSHFYVKQL